MKREHMNALTRFASLTSRLDKLQEQVATAAVDRARVVAGLVESMSYSEAGSLLGISAARVGQILKLINPATTETEGAGR